VRPVPPSQPESSFKPNGSYVVSLNKRIPGSAQFTALTVANGSSDQTQSTTILDMTFNMSVSQLQMSDVQIVSQTDGGNPLLPAQQVHLESMDAPNANDPTNRKMHISAPLIHNTVLKIRVSDSYYYSFTDGSDELSVTVFSDNTPPNLREYSNATRTNTTATVPFTSDKSGVYHYKVYSASESCPSGPAGVAAILADPRELVMNNTNETGLPNTLTVDGLFGPDEQKVCIVAVSSTGIAMTQPFSRTIPRGYLFTVRNAAQIVRPGEELGTVNTDANGYYSPGQLIPLQVTPTWPLLYGLNYWGTESTGRIADARAVSTTFQMPAMDSVVEANYTTSINVTFDQANDVDGVKDKQNTTYIDFHIAPDLTPPLMLANVDVLDASVNSGRVIKQSLERLGNSTKDSANYRLKVKVVEQGNVDLRINVGGRSFNPAKTSVEVYKDTTPPQIHSVLAIRDTKVCATVSFGASETGTFKYIVQNAQDSAPTPEVVLASGIDGGTLNESTPGSELTNRPNTLYLGNQSAGDDKVNCEPDDTTNLWDGSAKRVYIVSTDVYGNTVTKSFSIYIPIYTALLSAVQIGGVQDYATTKSLQLTFREPLEQLKASDLVIVPSAADEHTPKGAVQIASVVPTSDPKVWTVNLSSVIDQGYVDVSIKPEEEDGSTDHIEGSVPVEVFKNIHGPALTGLSATRSTLQNGAFTVTSSMTSTLKYCLVDLADTTFPNISSCTATMNLEAGVPKQITLPNFDTNPLGKRVYMIANGFNTTLGAYLDSDPKQVIIPTYTTINDQYSTDTDTQNQYATETYGDKNFNNEYLVTTKEVTIKLNTPVPDLSADSFIVGTDADAAQVVVSDAPDAVTTADGGLTYKVKLASVDRENQGQITLGIKNLPEACDMDALGFSAVPHCYKLGVPSSTDKAYVYADSVPPTITLTPGSVSRTGSTTGVFALKTSEKARYYYTVCDAGPETPEEVIAAAKSHTPEHSGDVDNVFPKTVSITDFANGNAHKVCLTSQDEGGNNSPVEVLNFSAFSTVVVSQTTKTDNTETTTKLTLTFSAYLKALNLSVNSGTTGAVLGTPTPVLDTYDPNGDAACLTTADPDCSYTEWEVQVTGITQTGQISIVPVSPNVQFSPAAPTVTVYHDSTPPVLRPCNGPGMELGLVECEDGPVSRDAAAEEIRFVVNEPGEYYYVVRTANPALAAPTAADILSDLDAESESVTDAEAETVLEVTIPPSELTSGQALIVYAVAKDRAGNLQTTPAQFYIPAYTTVAFEEVGSDKHVTNPTASTGIKMTFNHAVYDLRLSDITITDGAGGDHLGAAKIGATLTHSSDYKVWTVTLSEVTHSGKLTVALAEPEDQGDPTRYILQDYSDSEVQIYLDDSAPKLSEFTATRTSATTATFGFTSDMKATCTYKITGINDPTPTDDFTSCGDSGATSPATITQSITGLGLRHPYRVWFKAANFSTQGSISALGSVIIPGWLTFTAVQDGGAEDIADTSGIKLSFDPSIAAGDLTSAHITVQSTTATATYGSFTPPNLNIGVAEVEQQGEAQVTLDLADTLAEQYWTVPADSKAEEVNIYKDITAPTVTMNADGSRLSASSGRFTFKSSEYGDYCYFALGANESAPSAADICAEASAPPAGVSAGLGALSQGNYTLNADKTIQIDTLGTQEYKVYLVVKDAKGNAATVKTATIVPYIFIDSIDYTVSGNSLTEDTEFIYIMLNEPLASFSIDSLTIDSTLSGATGLATKGAAVEKVCADGGTDCATTTTWKVPLHVTQEGLIYIRLYGYPGGMALNIETYVPFYVYKDSTKPVIQRVESSETRTSTTAGSFTFSSSEAGTYKYLIKTPSESAPTEDAILNDGFQGTAAVGNTNTVSLTSLPDDGEAVVIYLVLSDASHAENVSNMLAVPLKRYLTYTVTANNGVENLKNTTQVQLSFSLPLSAAPQISLDFSGTGANLNNISNCGDADPETWCLMLTAPTAQGTAQITTVSSDNAVLGTSATNFAIHKNVDIPVVTLSNAARTSKTAGTVKVKYTSPTDTTAKLEYSLTNNLAESPGTWTAWTPDFTENAEQNKALTFDNGAPMKLWVRAFDGEAYSGAASIQIQGWVTVYSVNANGTSEKVTSTYIEVQFEQGEEIGLLDTVGAIKQYNWSAALTNSTLATLDLDNVTACPPGFTRPCYRIPVSGVADNALTTLTFTSSDYIVNNPAIEVTLHKNTAPPVISTDTVQVNYALGSSTTLFDPADEASVIAKFHLSAGWYNESTTTTALEYAPLANCTGEETKKNCFTFDLSDVQAELSQWKSSTTPISVQVTAYDNHTPVRSATREIKFLLQPGTFSVVPTIGIDGASTPYKVNLNETLTPVLDGLEGAHFAFTSGYPPDAIRTETTLIYQWQRSIDDGVTWVDCDGTDCTAKTTGPTAPTLQISAAAADATVPYKYRLKVTGEHVGHTADPQNGDKPGMTIYSEIYTATKATFPTISPQFDALKVDATTLANDINTSSEAPWGSNITGFSATCRWVDHNLGTPVSLTTPASCESKLPKNGSGVDYTPSADDYGKSVYLEVTLSAPGYETVLVKSETKTVVAGTFENSGAGAMQVSANGTFEAFSTVNFNFRLPDPNPWSLTANDGTLTCELYAATVGGTVETPEYTYGEEPIARFLNDDCAEVIPGPQRPSGDQFSEEYTIPQGLVGQALQMRMTASADRYQTRQVVSTPQVVALAKFGDVGFDAASSTTPYVAASQHNFVFTLPSPRPDGFTVECELFSASDANGAGASKIASFFAGDESGCNADGANIALSFMMPTSQVNKYVSVHVKYSATDYEDKAAASAYTLVTPATFTGLEVSNKNSETQTGGTANMNVKVPNPNPRSLGGTAKCTWYKTANNGVTSSQLAQVDCADFLSAASNSLVTQSLALTTYELHSADKIMLSVTVSAQGYTSQTATSGWIELNKPSYMEVSATAPAAATAHNTSRFALNIPVNTIPESYAKFYGADTTVTCGLYVVADAGADTLATVEDFEVPPSFNNGDPAMCASFSDSEKTAGKRVFDAKLGSSLVGKKIYLQAQVQDTTDDYAELIAKSPEVTVQKANFESLSPNLSGTKQYKQVLTANRGAINSLIDGLSQNVSDSVGDGKPWGGTVSCKFTYADDATGAGKTEITSAVDSDDTSVSNACTSPTLTPGYNLVGKYISFGVDIADVSGFNNASAATPYALVSPKPFEGLSGLLNPDTYTYGTENTMTLTLPDVYGFDTAQNLALTCHWVMAGSSGAEENTWQTITGSYAGDDTTVPNGATNACTGYTGTSATAKITPGFNLVNRYLGLVWTISAKGYETSKVYPSFHQVKAATFAATIGIEKTANYQVGVGTTISSTVTVGDNATNAYDAYKSTSWAYADPDADGGCSTAGIVSNQDTLPTGVWDPSSSTLTPVHTMYGKCIAAVITLERPGYIKTVQTDTFQVIKPGEFSAVSWGAAPTFKALTSTNTAPLTATSGTPHFTVTPALGAIKADGVKWQWSSTNTPEGAWQDVTPDYAEVSGNLVTPTLKLAALSDNGGGYLRAEVKVVPDIANNVTADSYAEKAFYSSAFHVDLADYTGDATFTYPRPAGITYPSQTQGIVDISQGGTIALTSLANVAEFDKQSIAWQYTSPDILGYPGENPNQGTSAQFTTFGETTGAFTPKLSNPAEESPLYRKYVRATYTVKAAGYANFTRTSGWVMVSGQVPRIGGNPNYVIAGTTVIGNTLTGTAPGALFDEAFVQEGPPSVEGLTYAYTWKANDSTISGTSNSLTLTSDHTGKSISSTITASAPYYFPRTLTSTNTLTPTTAPVTISWESFPSGNVTTGQNIPVQVKLSSTYTGHILVGTVKVFKGSTEVVSKSNLTSNIVSSSNTAIVDLTIPNITESGNYEFKVTFTPGENYTNVFSSAASTVQPKTIDKVVSLGLDSSGCTFPGREKPPQALDSDVMVNCHLRFTDYATNPYNLTAANITISGTASSGFTGITLGTPARLNGQIIYPLTFTISGSLVSNDDGQTLGNFKVNVNSPSLSLAGSDIVIDASKLAPAIEVPNDSWDFTNQSGKEEAQRIKNTVVAYVHGVNPKIPYGTLGIRLYFRSNGAPGQNSADMIYDASTSLAAENALEPNLTVATHQLPAFKTGFYTIEYTYNPSTVPQNYTGGGDPFTASSMFTQSQLVVPFVVSAKEPTLTITSAPVLQNDSGDGQGQFHQSTFDATQEIKGTLSYQGDPIADAGSVYYIIDEWASHQALCADMSQCLDTRDVPDRLGTVGSMLNTKSGIAAVGNDGHFTLKLPHFKVATDYKIGLYYSSDAGADAVGNYSTNAWEGASLTYEGSSFREYKVKKARPTLSEPVLKVPNPTTLTTDQQAETSFTNWPVWVPTPSSQLSVAGYDWAENQLDQRTVEITDITSIATTVIQKPKSGNYRICFQYENENSYTVISSLDTCHNYVIIPAEQSMSISETNLTTITTNTSNVRAYALMANSIEIGKVNGALTADYDGEVLWEVTAKGDATVLKSGIATSLRTDFNRYGFDLGKFEKGGEYTIHATWKGNPNNVNPSHASFNDITTPVTKDFTVGKVGAEITSTSTNPAIITTADMAPEYIVNIDNTPPNTAPFTLGSITLKIPDYNSAGTNFEFTNSFASGETSTVFTLPQFVVAGEKTAVITYSGDDAHSDFTDTRTFTVEKIAPTVTRTFNTPAKGYYNPTQEVTVTYQNTKPVANFTADCPSPVTNASKCNPPATTGPAVNASMTTSDVTPEQTYTQSGILLNTSTRISADGTLSLGTYTLTDTYANDLAYSDLTTTTPAAVQVQRDEPTLAWGPVAESATTNDTDKLAEFTETLPADSPAPTVSDIDFYVLHNAIRTYLNDIYITASAPSNDIVPKITYTITGTLPRLTPDDYYISAGVNENSAVSAKALNEGKDYVVSKHTITPTVSCSKEKWAYRDSTVSCTVKVGADDALWGSSSDTIWRPTGSLKLEIASWSRSYTLVQADHGVYTFLVEVSSVTPGENEVKVTYGGDSNLTGSTSATGDDAYKIEVVRSAATLNSLTLDNDGTDGQIQTTTNPGHPTAKKFRAKMQYNTLLEGTDISSIYTAPVITVSYGDDNAKLQIQMEEVMGSCTTPSNGTRTCEYIADVPAYGHAEHWLEPGTYSYVLNLTGNTHYYDWDKGDPDTFNVVKSDPVLVQTIYSKKFPEGSIHTTDEDVTDDVTWTNIGGYKPTGSVELQVYNVNPVENGAALPLHVFYGDAAAEMAEVVTESGHDGANAITRLDLVKALRNYGSYYFKVTYTGDDIYNEHTSLKTVTISSTSTVISASISSPTRTDALSNTVSGCVYPTIWEENTYVASNQPIPSSANSDTAIKIKVTVPANAQNQDVSVQSVETASTDDYDYQTPITDGCYSFDLGQFANAGTYNIKVMYDGNSSYSSSYLDTTSITAQHSELSEFFVNLLDHNDQMVTEQEGEDLVAEMTAPEGLTPRNGLVNYYMKAISGPALEMGLTHGMVDLNNDGLPDEDLEAEYPGDGVHSTFAVTCETPTSRTCAASWKQDIPVTYPGTYRVWAWYLGNSSLNPASTLDYKTTNPMGYYDFTVSKTPTTFELCGLPTSDTLDTTTLENCMAARAAHEQPPIPLTPSTTDAPTRGYLHTKYKGSKYALDVTNGVADWEVEFMGADGTGPAQQLAIGTINPAMAVCNVNKRSTEGCTLEGKSTRSYTIDWAQYINVAGDYRVTMKFSGDTSLDDSVYVQNYTVTKANSVVHFNTTPSNVTTATRSARYQVLPAPAAGNKPTIAANSGTNTLTLTPPADCPSTVHSGAITLGPQNSRIFTLPQLKCSGTWTVREDWSGNDALNASYTTTDLYVYKSTPTVTLGAYPSPEYVYNAVTIPVVVSGLANYTPTGEVILSTYDQVNRRTVELGTATLTQGPGDDEAEVKITFPKNTLTPGTYALTAEYTGDTALNMLKSSGLDAITMIKSTPTLEVISVPDDATTSTYDAEAEVRVTYDARSLAPVGSSLSSTEVPGGFEQVGNCELSQSDELAESCVFKGTLHRYETPGSKSITVNYAETTDHYAAVSPAATFTVIKTTPTVEIKDLPQDLTLNAPNFTATVDVLAEGYIPSGSISWMLTGPAGEVIQTPVTLVNQTGECLPTAVCKATAHISSQDATLAGSWTISATYSGNTSVDTASDSDTFSVGKADTTVVFSNAHAQGETGKISDGWQVKVTSVYMRLQMNGTVDVYAEGHLDDNAENLKVATAYITTSANGVGYSNTITLPNFPIADTYTLSATFTPTGTRTENGTVINLDTQFNPSSTLVDEKRTMTVAQMTAINDPKTESCQFWGGTGENGTILTTDEDIEAECSLIFPDYPDTPVNPRIGGNAYNLKPEHIEVELSSLVRPITQPLQILPNPVRANGTITYRLQMVLPGPFELNEISSIGSFNIHVNSPSLKTGIPIQSEVPRQKVKNYTIDITPPADRVVNDPAKTSEDDESEWPTIDFDAEVTADNYVNKAFGTIKYTITFEGTGQGEAFEPIIGEAYLYEGVVHVSIKVPRLYKGIYKIAIEYAGDHSLVASDLSPEGPFAKEFYVQGVPVHFARDADAEPLIAPDLDDEPELDDYATLYSDYGDYIEHEKVERPVVEGKRFAGWYDDDPESKNYGHPVDFNNTKVLTEMRLKSVHASRTPQIHIYRDGEEVSKLYVGDRILVKGQDFAPYEKVDVEIHSYPTAYLGYAINDAEGKFAEYFTVPDPRDHGMNFGAHTLWAGAVSGLADAVEVEAEVNILLYPNAKDACAWDEEILSGDAKCVDPNGGGGGGGSISATGVTLQVLLLLLVLLLLGVFISRRRDYYSRRPRPLHLH
jgi:hypothetical protein